MKQLLPLFLLLCLSANAQEQFTVYFDFDVAEANSTSNKSLAQWIAEHPEAEILNIYGFTDKTGNELYNRDLSERRALYVYQQLKAATINVEHVEEKGFGESQSTAAYNAKDRKVEIHYTQVAPTVAAPIAAPVSTTQPKPVETEFSKQVTSAKKGDKILLKTLNFYNNEDVMLPSSGPILRELLTMLKEHPTLKIQIQGHVCCEPENKIKLSRKRAVAVYNYLVSKGISKKRLSYTSFGSTRPLYPVPEKTEEERIANRRVEIEIVEN